MWYVNNIWDKFTYYAESNGNQGGTYKEDPEETMMTWASLMNMLSKHIQLYTFAFHTNMAKTGSFETQYWINEITAKKPYTGKHFNFLEHWIAILYFRRECCTSIGNRRMLQFRCLLCVAQWKKCLYNCWVICYKGKDFLQFLLAISRIHRLGFSLEIESNKNPEKNLNDIFPYDISDSFIIRNVLSNVLTFQKSFPG